MSRTKQDQPVSPSMLAEPELESRIVCWFGRLVAKFLGQATPFCRHVPLHKLGR